MYYLCSHKDFNMITRRIEFNLQGFIKDLHLCLTEDRPDLIDDTVQRYKDFLSRTKEPLLSKVKNYVDNHPLVTGNKRVKSFINACYKSNFCVK